ncbi:hypothetical protein J4404_01445 [Candidatus Woesearchaeota archaeon]|nr:hypothetical protein [Candidatus Woesearchaeota archaeon]
MAQASIKDLDEIALLLYSNPKIISSDLEELYCGNSDSEEREQKIKNLNTAIYVFRSWNMLEPGYYCFVLNEKGKEIIKNKKDKNLFYL